MFKRENRLIPGARFANPPLFSNSLLILKEKKNGLNINRFGIVVSKKVDSRSVARNKVKRQMREGLAIQVGKLTLGHDILVIAKKEIKNKSKEDVAQAIREALEKSKLIAE